MKSPPRQSNAKHTRARPIILEATLRGANVEGTSFARSSPARTSAVHLVFPAGGRAKAQIRENNLPGILYPALLGVRKCGEHAGTPTRDAVRARAVVRPAINAL